MVERAGWIADDLVLEQPRNCWLKQAHHIDNRHRPVKLSVERIAVRPKSSCAPTTWTTISSKNGMLKTRVTGVDSSTVSTVPKSCLSMLPQSTACWCCGSNGQDRAKPIGHLGISQ